MRVWDVTSGRCVTTLVGHTGQGLERGVERRWNPCVSGSEDRTVRVWDLASGRCVATL